MGSRGNSNAEFCAIVCAYGTYRQYAPLFTATMLTSFPTAHVRVYMRGTTNRCQRQFDLIRRRLSQEFTVIDDWCLKAKPVLELRTKRWFVDPEPLLEFKYCYWCDIDFIVLPVMPDLIEKHVEHMKLLDKPYSNMVRRNAKKQWRKRMTGLHFVETAPYYRDATGFLSAYNQLYIF